MDSPSSYLHTRTHIFLFTIVLEQTETALRHVGRLAAYNCNANVMLLS